jgi:hypothetical protein
LRDRARREIELKDRAVTCLQALKETREDDLRVGEEATPDIVAEANAMLARGFYRASAARQDADELELALDATRETLMSVKRHLKTRLQVIIENAGRAIIHAPIEGDIIYNIVDNGFVSVGDPLVFYSGDLRNGARTAVRSPKDAFIERIAVADGDQVRADQLLMSLTREEEEVTAAQQAILRSLLSQAQKAISGEHVAIREESDRRRISAANAGKDFRVLAKEMTQDKGRVEGLRIVDTLFADLSVARADAELADANFEHEVAAARLAEARASLESVAAVLDAEEAIVKARLAACDLKSCFRRYSSASCT